MAAISAEPQIVDLGPGDAAAGLTLSDEAGWNQTLLDWSYFLSHGDVFGIRDAEGRVRATAAVLPMPPVAWISLVLVTADWRRRGLASALLSHCIEAARARGLEAWLDATPAGAAVYGQMGFQSLANGFQRLRRQAVGAQRPIAAPHRLDEGLLGRLLAGDRRAVGFDRSSLLTHFAERPGSTLYETDGAVCLVRDGRHARHIGPVLAGSEPQALALLGSVSEAEAGSLVIDLAEPNGSALAGLIVRGFAIERPFRRMCYGTPRPRGLGVAPIASAGPEFG